MENLREKWKPVLVLALIAASALSFFVLYLSHKNRMEAARVESIVRMESAIQSASEVYGRLAEMAFDQTVRRPEIRELFLKAQQAGSESERTFWRIAIAGRIEPVFSQLGYYRFRFLDLIQPDGTVFLRMHDPGKFGDNILAESELQKIALRYRIPAQGFQPGAVFSLYRYSFPLFMGNAFLGSAEFGLSSAVMAEQLKRQFPGHYTLLLNREVLDPLLTPETRSNFVPSRLSAQYIEDIQVRDLPTPLADPDPETQSLIMNKVSRQAAASVKEGKSFTLFTRVGARPYAVTFVQVANPGGKPIGYIVAINRNSRASEIQQVTLTVAILLAGLLTLSAAFLRQGIRQHEKLIEEALYDSLTGGLKQGRFDAVSARETAMATRYGLPLSLIIFDLDYFKQINDRWGHLKGDAVLRAIGKAVVGNIRSVDYFFRWGGDEFLVVLPSTAIEGALCAAEKIRLLVGNLEIESIRGLSISAGVAQMRTDDSDLRTVLKRADEALYRSKEKGRNMVSV
ncbi:MAG: GGDEF domain-containing protein [Synergistales bacterium]